MALYLPRDFGPAIVFGAWFQVPVARQWGREMSAPLGLIYNTKKFLYMCRNVPGISSMWYVRVCLATEYGIFYNCKLQVLQLRVRKCKETKSIVRLRVLRVPIQLWGQVSKCKCKKTKSKRDIICLQGLKKNLRFPRWEKKDKKQALSLSL